MEGTRDFEWCDSVYSKVSDRAERYTDYIDGRVHYGYIMKHSICDRMIQNIDDSIWSSPESKVADIFVQDTMLLLHTIGKFNIGLRDSIPDPKKRIEHIVNNCIYGIFVDENICKAFKGLLGVTGNNITSYRGTAIETNNSELIKMAHNIIKESWNMKFDVVIGNPPYNNGMDIDFIDLSYGISNGSTVMIVPAKWQTAKDDHRIISRMSYGNFRKKYAEHIKSIVYYNDSWDIFDAIIHEGVTIIHLDKDIHTSCLVENESKLATSIVGSEVRSISNQLSLCNIAYKIANKIGLNGSNGLKIESLNKDGKYKVLAGKFADFGYVVQSRGGDSKRNYYKEGNTLATQMCCLDAREYGGGVIYSNGDTKDKDIPKSYVTVYASDNLQEAKSFMSLLGSKLVRFMIFYQISSYNNIINDNTFRYVPNIVGLPLDHEYSDEEIYSIYNINGSLAEAVEKTIKSR